MLMMHFELQGEGQKESFLTYQVHYQIHHGVGEEWPAAFPCMLDSTVYIK